MSGQDGDGAVKLFGNQEADDLVRPGQLAKAERGGCLLAQRRVEPVRATDRNHHIALAIVAGMVTVVLGAIGLVMESASLALIYIDIRMRKEGLDLELLHFVEAKQSGTNDVANPYLLA